MLRCLVVFLALLAPAVVRAADAPPQAVERAAAATLVLYSADDAETFLGSALIWRDGRHALTNAHVVGAAERVLAVYRDGRRAVVPVRARDAGRDIAVLDLPGDRPGLDPAPAVPAPGTPVIALGAPLALGFTATRGIVSAAPRQVEARVPLRLVQHDAALNPGSSGGPLVDAQGRLIGMNSRIADGSRLFVGVSYAIGAVDLGRLVPLLLAGALPPLPDLGIDLRPVGRRIASALALPEAGLLIDDVRPGGAAAAGGLRAGDVLLSVRGRKLATPGDLAFALEGAGPEVTVTLLRDGRRLIVVLPLDAVRQAPEPAAETAPDTTSLADLSVALDAAGRVTALPPGGVAARDGLAVGDRILRLNGAEADADTLLRARVSSALVLLVARDGRRRHVILDPWASRIVHRPVGGGNRLDLAVERF